MKTIHSTSRTRHIRRVKRNARRDMIRGILVILLIICTIVGIFSMCYDDATREVQSIYGNDETFYTYTKTIITEWLKGNSLSLT